MSSSVLLFWLLVLCLAGAILLLFWVGFDAG